MFQVVNNFLNRFHIASYTSTEMAGDQTPASSILTVSWRTKASATVPVTGHLVAEITSVQVALLRGGWSLHLSPFF